MATTKNETTGRPGRLASRKRYGAFHRVSRVAGRDDKLRSPEMATAAMEAFAKAEGILLDEVVVELDVSGSKTNESAELMRLVDRVERGELDGIVVAKLDRLSRLPARQRVELVERIGNERLLSATESNDVATPEGRFVRELFFSIARMEWERYARGFELAKQNAIAAGVSTSRRPAFGLAFDADHRYVPGTPEEVATLRAMFELRAAGGSYGDVLELFEESTGKSSSRQTIKELLENRVYLGELRVGELVNESAHAAIVDRELFDRVQAVSAERRVETGWHGRRTTLLAGIARCACCGAGLARSSSNKGRSIVYKCPSDTRHCSARASIGLAELDAYVVEYVLEWAGPVADELVELEIELDARGDRIVLEHGVSEARRVLREWAENVEKELEDEVAYRAGLKAREELVARRELELLELGEASEVELARATIRTALAGEELDLEEKRRLLSVVLDGVVVSKTPRRGAPASERAELLFAMPAGAILEDAPELAKQASPQVAVQF